MILNTLSFKWGYFHCCTKDDVGSRSRAQIYFILTEHSHSKGTAGYIVEDLILAFQDPQGTYTLNLYYIKKKTYIAGYINSLQYVNGFERVLIRDLY